MSIATARPSLTSNDASVLQALFDAESSPSSGVKIDSSLPVWPTKVKISPDDLASLKSQETEVIRKLHAAQVPIATQVESAIQSLDDLIKRYPSYPAVYANRAQALRMMVDIKSNTSSSNSTEAQNDGLFQPEFVEIYSRVLSDLGQAISLATPESPADPVSPTQARLLADAYTHRGYLLLKAARTKKTTSEGTGPESLSPARLRNLSADELEEMASHDFFLGGRYGSKVAQQLSVQTNPYAKMCGAIVKESMRKEMQG